MRCRIVSARLYQSVSTGSSLTGGAMCLFRQCTPCHAVEKPLMDDQRPTPGNARSLWIWFARRGRGGRRIRRRFNRGFCTCTRSGRAGRGSIDDWSYVFRGFWLAAASGKQRRQDQSECKTCTRSHENSLFDVQSNPVSAADARAVATTKVCLPNLNSRAEPLGYREYLTIGYRP